MSLNIKNAETYHLVQELAVLTGETQTMAVTIASANGWSESGTCARPDSRTDCSPSARTPRRGCVSHGAAPITATSFMTTEDCRDDHRHLCPDRDLARRDDASDMADAIEQARDRQISAANYLEAAVVIDGSRDPVASRRFDELVQAAELRIEPVTQDQA